MGSLEFLNQRFAHGEQLRFKEADDSLLVAEINSVAATASVSLQGGHLMLWRPKTQAEPVIWMSSEAQLKLSKSLRGGIPICWPWFGPHISEADFPAHGYARTAQWEVKSSEVLEDGEVVLVLSLLNDSRSERFWPYPTALELEVVVGERLKLALTTTNLGDQSFVIGEALHTYFQVSDIGQVSVAGLDGVSFYDKVSNAPLATQQGEIGFAAETDSVYVNTQQSCVINDPGYQRRIVIDKRGSDSTVVWNPWIDKANKMGDLGPNGWRRMVCVESANAFDNLVTVEPGVKHSLAVTYGVEALQAE